MFAENENFKFGTIGDIQENVWNKVRHPYVGGIELTPYCNLQCVHCYLQDFKKKDLLSTSQIKLMIDKLFDAGVLFLYFTGGEIFTRKDFLEIYVYAKKKGFIIELLTNGTLIDERVLEVFNEYPPASVSISMYGKNEESYKRVTGISGVYEKVIHTFDMLKENQIHFEIKYIGMEENEDDFFSVKKIAENYNAVFSYTMELFPTLNGNNCTKNHMIELEKIVDIEKTYEVKRKEIEYQTTIENPFLGRKEVPLYLCDMAVSNFLIDYRGYINPCHKCRMEKWNLLNCSLKEAWDDFGNIRKQKAATYNKCIQCKYIMMCSPCVLVNYLSTGDYNIPSDTVCKLTHMRVEMITKS